MSKSQLAGLLDLCGVWASSEHSDDSQSSPEWSGVKETIDHLYHLLNQWYLFCFVISYFPHTNDLTHEDLPSSRKRDGWLEMASKHKLLCLKSFIFALHPPFVPRLKSMALEKKVCETSEFLCLVCASTYPNQSHPVKFASGIVPSDICRKSWKWCKFEIEIITIYSYICLRNGLWCYIGLSWHLSK